MRKEAWTITRKDWDAIVSAADRAIEEIPERHNRIRIHTYAEEIARGLHDRQVLREVETSGAAAIYRKSKNIGSRRYPDYVDEFDEIKTKDQGERRKNLWYIF